jgi:hypothetical protein
VRAVGPERTMLSTAFREMLMNAIEHGGARSSEWVVSRVRTRRTIVYHIDDPGEVSPGLLKHAAISIRLGTRRLTWRFRTRRTCARRLRYADYDPGRRRGNLQPEG